MRIQIGNMHAIEGYRDEADPGVLKYRELPGERVTTILIPEGFDIGTAANTVVATMDSHIARGARPSWIECDDETLYAYLCEHYGLKKTHRRPPTWGSGLEPNDAPPPKKKSAKARASKPQPTAGDETGEG